MLNARHKSILFLTLVITGCALLAGASLTQGFGLVILGVAFAWLVGSDTIYRAWSGLRKLPAALAPWLRFPFILALAGGVFGAVLYWSNFNTFLAVGVMIVWGLLISSERLVVAKHSLARLTIFTAGFLAFFFALVVACYFVRIPVEKMESVGKLAVSALIGIAFGRFWLSKAVPSIVGTFKRHAPEGVDVAGAAPAPQQHMISAIALYFSLFAGVLTLAFWIALLAFNGFTESVVPLPSAQATSGTTSVPQVYAVALVFMLLTWWPYAAWSGILRRQPQMLPAHRTRHATVLVTSAVLATIFIAVAATLGLQNGRDRALTARLEANETALSQVAQKIGAVKGRNLETTDEYINAYSEIAPLLDEFDQSLTSLERLLAEVNERDKRRGVLEINLFSAKRQRQPTWNSRVFKLLRDDVVITRKQVGVTAQMAALPEVDRIALWNEQFLPLAEEEARLREELTYLMNGNAKRP